MNKYSISDMHSVAKSRGGRCLSSTYINKRTRLLWECANGHQWKAIPDSVLRGSWCVICSGAARLTIEDMHTLAKERGGKCLSDSYVNNKTKLLWECSNDHQWEAEPNRIKRGSWCPACAGVTQLTIKEMNEIAQDRGGACLSARYINNSTKLRWQCSRKHQWEARPHDIKNGSWCPRCYNLNRSKMKEMSRLAKKRGGQCLSRYYANDKTKLLWECNDGHKWKTTPSIIKRGSWCPICAKG